MFKKKKKQQYENTYDRQWNEIVNRRIDIGTSIDELFADIKYSTDVLLCFEKDSANWNVEDKRLRNLKHKMLCECGGFDETNYDIKELLNNHKAELQPQFCISYNSLTSNPLIDCNTYLRYVAKSFKKHG